MEKLTLRRSTISGTIQGKPVLSTVRAASDGLLLPAGQYLLRPPVDNPVYGQVMAIEPLPASASAMTIDSPSIKFDSPSIKFDSPSIKFDSPSIKFDSPSIKFDRTAGTVLPVVITSRPIPGNGFVVMSGLGDLFETVKRAGGVILVVE